MTRARRIVVLSLLGLAVSIPGTAMVGWAQAKSELTIALSSFSAETVDPALQGHNVKYYLSLMFDYLSARRPTASRLKRAGSPRSGRTRRPQALDVHLRKASSFTPATR